MTCSFSLQIGGFEEVSLVSKSGEAFLFVLYDQKKRKAFRWKDVYSVQHEGLDFSAQALFIEGILRKKLMNFCFNPTPNFHLQLFVK